MCLTALPVAFLHLSPAFRAVEANRQALFHHVVKAAQAGAKLILTPELCVSGYGFDGVEEAAECAETQDGPTLQGLSALCQHHGIYCVVGLLEKSSRTGLLHNSAFALGPAGTVLARHRKLVSVERRWATPGCPQQTSCFETPWGKMGMLVCADSYTGLPARTLALQGADVLLVLANWPPGGVDPRHLWRARALENGVGLLACNRTGIDRRMDCREARSYAVDHRGQVLLDHASSESGILPVALPLGEDQENRCQGNPGHPRLCHRKAALFASREPAHWRGLGLDVNGDRVQHWLWGPPPDQGLEIFAANPQTVSPQSMGQQTSHGLRVLVCADALEARPTQGPGSVMVGHHAGKPWLATPEGIRAVTAGDHLLAHCQGYRIGVCSPEALRHPELAVHLAKSGCDLLCVPGAALEEDWRTVLATRCLERLPVVLATQGENTVYLPPEGHKGWKAHDLLAAPLRLDVGHYRQRQLFDRLDLDTLLASPGAP